MQDAAGGAGQLQARCPPEVPAGLALVQRQTRALASRSSRPKVSELLEDRDGGCPGPEVLVQGRAGPLHPDTAQTDRRSSKERTGTDTGAHTGTGTRTQSTACASWTPLRQIREETLSCPHTRHKLVPTTGPAGLPGSAATVHSGKKQ